MTPSTMKEGRGLLDAGRTTDALICFLEVRDEYRQDHDGSSNADVEQMLGICYRMLRRYHAAERAFAIALALTDDPVHKGRIERDRAMVPLEQGQLDMAKHRLEQSLNYLRTRDNIEYFVSIGFMGRMHFAGKNADFARHYLQLADYQLRALNAPPIYILNNLVWRLKVATGIRERWRLARRAWQLVGAVAKNHGKPPNRKRQTQIILLTVCRPLGLRLER